MEADREREVIFNTGATLHAIWLNGEKIFEKRGGWTGWHAGKERVPARLRAGENRIVIEAGSSFFVSVTEDYDWPLPYSDPVQ